MGKLSDRKFHISNAPYARFSELVKKMAEDGHLKHDKVGDKAGGQGLCRGGVLWWCAMVVCYGGVLWCVRG